jgi:Fe-S-cluster containining protein
MKQDRRLRRILKTTCTRCATCCIEPIPPVTDSDVRRLAKGTGKPASSIVRFYSSTEMDYGAGREGWVEFSYGKRVMGLRQPKGQCLFLDDDCHCSVYEHRPVTCRTFPFDVELDEAGRIGDLGLNPAPWCRREQGPGVNPGQLRDDARREAIEDELYFRRVSRWNRSPKRAGKAEFLAFLGLD